MNKTKEWNRRRSREAKKRTRNKGTVVRMEDRQTTGKQHNKKTRTRETEAEKKGVEWRNKERND